MSVAIWIEVGALLAAPALALRVSAIELPTDREVVLSSDAGAYRLDDGTITIASFDGASLNVDAPAGGLSAIAWDADTSEWLVALETREPLRPRDFARIRASVDLIPIDRKTSRARVLRYRVDGHLRASKVFASAPAGFGTFVLEGSRALLRQRSAEPSCGDAPAHDNVTLAAHRAGHRVPGCVLARRLRGALVRTDRGSVAAVTACSTFDDADAVQLLAFDRNGRAKPSPDELLPVTGNAFDLRWHDKRLWLARAIGTQIVIERLGADLRPDAAGPLLLDNERSHVIALQFVGDDLDLVVRRDLMTYRLAAAAGLHAGKLSHLAAPEPLEVRACPQRRW